MILDASICLAESGQPARADGSERTRAVGGDCGDGGAVRDLGRDRSPGDPTFEKVPGLLVQQQGAPIPLFSSLPAAWKDEIAAIPGVAVVNSEVMVRVNLIEQNGSSRRPGF